MTLVEFLEAQPMFTGLVGATVAGGAMFMLRQAPVALWNRLADLFTVTLVIEHREAAFAFVNEWLSKSDAVARARRLMVSEAYDYEEGRWEWSMTLGRGWHLLRYAGAVMMIHREVRESGDLSAALGKGPEQRFWIRSIGRSQRAIRALIVEAKKTYFGDGLLKVFTWDQEWRCVDRRRPRPLDTVFMPAAQKARIIDDLSGFIGARDVYGRRGVPWRRGYLFKGPPGTGKTTMIAAAAGQFGRSVCALNLNNIQNDNQLVHAFNMAPHDAVIVIEDIDTAKITHDRDVVAAKEEKLADAGLAPKPEERPGVSLSGLLNAIDGLAAREGRILFITSNCPEKLDPALLRPGRIDITEDIAPLGRAEAAAMIAAFDADPSIIDTLTFPAPAAALQARLLATTSGDPGADPINVDAISDPGAGDREAA